MLSCTSLDDYGLRSLDLTQSTDLYAVIVERHKRSSSIFTSNGTKGGIHFALVDTRCCGFTNNRSLSDSTMFGILIVSGTKLFQKGRNSVVEDFLTHPMGIQLLAVPGLYGASRRRKVLGCENTR